LLLILITLYVGQLSTYFQSFGGFNMKNLWFWLTMAFFLVLFALTDLTNPDMSVLFSFY